MTADLDEDVVDDHDSLNPRPEDWAAFSGVDADLWDEFFGAADAEEQMEIRCREMNQNIDADFEDYSETVCPYQGDYYITDYVCYLGGVCNHESIWPECKRHNFDPNKIKK
jgi:hypothetical protein